MALSSKRGKGRHMWEAREKFLQKEKGLLFFFRRFLSKNFYVRTRFLLLGAKIRRLMPDLGTPRFALGGWIFCPQRETIEGDPDEHHHGGYFEGVLAQV